MDMKRTLGYLFHRNLAVFHLLKAELSFIGFKFVFGYLKWHQITTLWSRASEGNPQRSATIPKHELSHAPSLIEWDECTRMLVVPRSNPRTAVQTSLLASLIANIARDLKPSIVQLTDSNFDSFDIRASVRSLFGTHVKLKHVFVFVEMEPPGGAAAVNELFEDIESFGLCGRCSRPLVSLVSLTYDTESWDHVKETYWVPSNVQAASDNGTKILDAHFGPLALTAPREIACLVEPSFPVAAAEVGRLRIAAGIDTKDLVLRNRSALATITGTSKWLRPAISFVSEMIASSLDQKFNNSLGAYLPAAHLAEALFDSDSLINSAWRMRDGESQFYTSGNVLLSLGMGCQVLNYTSTSGESFMTSSQIPRHLIWDFHDYDSLFKHLHFLANESPNDKRRRRSAQLEWFDSVTSLDKLASLVDVPGHSPDSI